MKYIIALTIALSLTACNEKKREVPVKPGFLLSNYSSSSDQRGYKSDETSEYLKIWYKLEADGEVQNTEVLATFPTYWVIFADKDYNRKQGIYKAGDFIEGIFWNRKTDWRFFGSIDPQVENDPEYTKFDQDPTVNIDSKLNFPIYVHEDKLSTVKHIQEHGIFSLTPKFDSKKDGKEEYDCETEIREVNFHRSEPIEYEGDTINFTGSGIINESGAINWALANQTIGKTSFRIFIDYGARKYAMSDSNSTFPYDIDKDGSVWEDIAAGSDEFICLQTYDAKGTFRQKVDCSNGLNITNGEYRQIIIPQRLESLQVIDGKEVIITQPMGYYSHRNNWLPGKTNAKIGSCRLIKS